MIRMVLLFASLALAGCSCSNNLLLGTVEATVGSHRVIVTDCYRTEVPPPQRYDDAGVMTWQFAPCRDAVVVIRGDKLRVNDRPYGHLGASDGVLVDHGVVSIRHGNVAQRGGN